MDARLDRKPLRAGEPASVFLHGEVDLASAAQVAAALHAFLDDAAQLDPLPSVLELDLRSVTFLDSSGLKVLLAVQQRCEALGLALIVPASRPVRRVLDVTGLSDLFPPA